MDKQNNKPDITVVFSDLEGTLITICPLNSPPKLRSNRRCVIGFREGIYGINDGFSQVLSSLEKSTDISHDDDDGQSL